jgi:hypothetical protein
MMMHQLLPEEPSAPAVEEVNEEANRKPAKKQGKTKNNKSLVNI